MGIKYKHGAEEVQALAQQAGKAQAAQQELQRQFQKEMGVMQFQMELEAQRRAQLWELEKAEIASRNDFAREERIRAQKLEERDRKLKAIEESEIIPEDKKEYYRMQVMGVEGLISPAQQAQIDLRSRALDIQEQRIEASKDPMAELIDRLSNPSAAPTVVDPVQAKSIAKVKQSMQPLSAVPPARIPQRPDGQFVIFDSDGNKYAAPPDELPQYIAEGYFTVPLPAPEIPYSPEERVQSGLKNTGQGLNALRSAVWGD